MVHISFGVTNLVILLLLIGESDGDPRAQIIDENVGTAYCGNTMLSGDVFQDSVRHAVMNAVMNAPKNSDFLAKESLSGAYVQAQCWNTWNESSCTDCLAKASESILRCLPASEGRALYTGCFLRYSDTNFLNQESDESSKSQQVILMSCENQQVNNRSRFIPNLLKAMEDIDSEMQTSRTRTVVTGIGPESTYVLAQCYGDFSTSECLLCLAVARTILPSCLPSIGGRVYLEGCFMRFQNHYFFGGLTGKDDTIFCGNESENDEFQRAASKAVQQAAETAPKNWNLHAAIVSGAKNNSVYAAADCWSTLGAEACTQCLANASSSMLGCLPGSMSYACYTGCFIRYSDTKFLNPHYKRQSKGRNVIIVSAVSSMVVFMVAIIIVIYAWKGRNKSKTRKGSNDTKLLKILNGSSLNVKYSMIEKATGSFDEANKLGQGGFGAVYKGVLPNGREIAAKRLFFNHKHRAGDFYNEVNIISSVEHKNLVKLVGFSCLGPESVLIYEYLPNKSLDHFIFDPIRGKELIWAKRYDIILGIAEGLVYLHENSKTRIIHRDIKAANILLDLRLDAKIADFGLARSFQQDNNHISTGIAGTLGYMAPEYIACGKLSEKVDVYSYGVLLLEIVTGMPNRGMQTSEDTRNLILIAWERFKQGSLEEIFDPNLMLNNKSSSKTKKEIERVVHIGLLCIQEVASLRPTMSMALQMLSKNIDPLPSPANPPYVTDSTIQLNEFGAIHRANNPASLPTVSYSSFIPR